MALGVELKSVALLLDKIYFIRSYQRGYRWDDEQVNDLLDDFKEFIAKDNKTEQEFYCLQPIVVKKLSKDEKDKSCHILLKNLSEPDIYEKDIYEVIDGQQRLTTLQLILSYLQNDMPNIKISFFPKIIYEVRPASASFLEKFRSNPDMTALKKSSIENIDFHHMYKIYIAISQWFERNKDFKERILKLLTSLRINNVRVIWYEVNYNENAIAVFRRFNIGKIPLNNAELIKAVLLKDDNNLQPAVKYIISQQWEKFENQLQDKFFWSFLNPGKNYNSRIEYLFDLIYELEVKDHAKYGHQKVRVFRYFNDLLGGSKEELLTIWDKVSDLFEELNQFYHHPEHYHYIGYLNNKEGRGEFNILQILQAIGAKESAIKDKDSLTAHLFSLVKFNTRNFFNQNKIKLNYESSKVELRDFFLLLNVEATKKLNASIDKEFAYRYSFHKHRETTFDIEHIGSQTDKKPKTDEEKIEYLKDFHVDYFDDISAEIKTEMLDLWIDSAEKKPESLWEPENINMKALKQKYDILGEKIQRFIDEQDQLRDKNSIGNLTLLNSNINRSYGNVFFPTKRKLLIQKDLEGEFILPCTKNVFLKYYSAGVNKHTRWTENDVIAYETQLNKILEKYF